MDKFIVNYTGGGQTIDGVAYTARDVKLITFMGGANDGFGKATWLGSPTSMDPNYIYGACNYMFRRLHENFPNARIICILQPANYSDKMEYPDDATAQTLGFANLAEMQTWDIYSFGQYKMECKERAVKECAERFGIRIVDCIFDWYSVVNPTQRAKYWDADKIHLSGEGSRALAEKLDREGILAVFGK
jgi:lysophospholipase L1-like esterase